VLAVGRPTIADVVTTDQAYDVPRIDGLAVNEKIDDWGDSGFHVNIMGWNPTTSTPPTGFQPSFRLGWNDSGLVALVDVPDPSPIEESTGKALYLDDAVEFIMAAKPGATDLSQIIVSPGSYRIISRRDFNTSRMVSRPRAVMLPRM